MTWLTSRATRAILPLFVCACSSSSPSTTPGGVAPDSDTGPESDAAVASSAEGSAPPSCPSFVASSLSSCATPPTTGAFPADVAAVLGARCQTCHKSPPINHAPFSLLTYEDTLKPDPLCGGVPIWQAMHYVIQPNSIPHMPFGNAPQLTSTQLQTLDGWLTGCAVPAAMDAGADDAAGE